MAGDRATKMLILSSARTLFSEKGYDPTPVEEICELAGIAKGTFFYYFESKQSIVRYILAMQMDEYRNQLMQQMNSLQDAISRVEYFIAALIEQAETAPETDCYFKDRPADWYERWCGKRGRARCCRCWKKWWRKGWSRDISTSRIPRSARRWRFTASIRC